MKDSVEAYK